MPLEASDQRRLQAAVGYIELGIFEEANDELEEIDPFCRHLPEVLPARLAIYRGLKKWELFAAVAKRLAEWNPKEPGFFIEFAYAHQAHRINSRSPRDPDASCGPASNQPNDPIQPRIRRQEIRRRIACF